MLLVLCLGSSGSIVRASCLSRYAHYTPPQPLVLQAQSLQGYGLQDYLASSSITYLPMHCLGLNATIYTEKNYIQESNLWHTTGRHQKLDGGKAWKFRNTSLVHTCCCSVQNQVHNRVHNPVHSPVHSPVQSPESRFCTYPTSEHLGSLQSLDWTSGLDWWTGPVHGLTC